MEEVASAAGLSRSTIYRYFASREHLIAEVTLAAGNRLTKHWADQPPKGNTSEERVRNLCDELTQKAEENTVFLGVCVANLASQDPAVLDTYAEIEHLVGQFLATALGEAHLVERTRASGILFRFLLGSFILATTGKQSFQAVNDELQTLCRTLLADGPDQQCETVHTPTNS